MYIVYPAGDTQHPLTYLCLFSFTGGAQGVVDGSSEGAAADGANPSCFITLIPPKHGLSLHYLLFAAAASTAFYGSGKSGGGGGG